MTAVDLALVAGALALVVTGRRLGLLASAAWLLGAGAGLAVGGASVRVVRDITGPLVPLAALLVTLTLVVGAGMIGALLGLAGAERLARLAPPGRARAVDGWGGAALGLVAALVGAWVLAPTLAAGGPLHAGSARLLAAAAPAPPDAVGGLRATAGDTRWPRIRASLNPDADQGPPPARVDIGSEARARVEAATYLVEGRSCARMQDGTGFVAAEGVLVTNAHVVAGVSGPVRVLQPGQPAREASVTYFDAARDLALLRMPNTPAPIPLSERPPAVGSVGLVFGHPDGSRTLSAAPARVDRVIDALGRDLYNREPTQRQVLVLGAEIRAGYSGGPLVNSAGQLIGVAFAVAPDRTTVAYALALPEVRAALVAEQPGPVDTGPCVG